MSKSNWNISSFMDVSRRSMQYSDLPTDRVGNLDPSKIPGGFDIFSVNTFAHLAGFKDVGYFVRSVMPEHFSYEVLSEFDVPRGHRPITVYGTCANTVVYEAERYHEERKEQQRQKALRQRLLTSSSSLSG